MSDQLTPEVIGLAATLVTTNALLAEVRDALEGLTAKLDELGDLPGEVRLLREETHELRLKLTPWKPEAQR